MFILHLAVNLGYETKPARSHCLNKPPDILLLLLKVWYINRLPILSGMERNMKHQNQRWTLEYEVFIKPKTINHYANGPDLMVDWTHGHLWAYNIIIFIMHVIGLPPLDYVPLLYFIQMLQVWLSKTYQTSGFWELFG